MIKSKTLFQVGTGIAAIVSAVAFTSGSALANKKAAIEVVTHAGAGGGTGCSVVPLARRSTPSRRRSREQPGCRCAGSRSSRPPLGSGSESSRRRRRSF